MSDNDHALPAAQGALVEATDSVPEAASEGGLPGIRLKSLDFTDLFFSEKGDAFIRGLDTLDGAPLTQVPAEAVSDLDELHRRVCQRGQSASEFSMDYDGMRFRVSKIVDVQGVWYTLRRAKFPIPRFGELGINPHVVRHLGQLGKPGRHGLLIIAGKTGEGKTTTACSLLQEYLLHFGDVAVTIEDPVELPMNGPHGKHGHCFQTEVTNGDFADAMRRTMRRSPRYILLGEVRGAHEASQAIKAAMNGHLVITTIHAGNCIEALQSLIKFVSGAEDIELARNILADGLVGVLHQKLTRVKGVPGRKLSVQWLFAGADVSGVSVRNKIRSGKFVELGTDIQQQENRVKLGKPPVDG